MLLDGPVLAMGRPDLSQDRPALAVRAARGLRPPLASGSLQRWSWSAPP